MVLLVRNSKKKENFIWEIILVGLIHGDMAQYDRTQVINDFKKRDMPILIATDVAGLLFFFFLWIECVGFRFD